MLLNSLEVFKHLSSVNTDALQQVSVDLTVKNIKMITGGYILKDRKHVFPYHELDKSPIIGNKSGWFLGEGVYSITFEEDCLIPHDKTGMILHKSSLVRIGCTLDCGIYDPGYKSEGGMGAVLSVMIKTQVMIEEGSKIATFYMFQNSPVSPEHLYNGSYQGNKDIK